MARLVLNLLGTFHAILDGRPVDNFRYDKVRALLAYLAAESDRPHRRDKLVGLLWAGFSESSARRSLSQALYHLRNVLGDREADVPFLLVTGSTIQLNPESDVKSDTHLLQSALESGELTDLEAAMQAYRGSFLSGLLVDDCPAFDEWVVLRRESFHQQAVAVLHRLAELYEEEGDLRSALRVAQRQVALDPFWEEGRRALMRLLAAHGQRNAALAQYEELQRLLDSELGVEPELATTQLVEQIRSERAQVTLQSALGRIGRDRRTQVRVGAFVALMVVTFALSARALMEVRRGPPPFDPRPEIAGVSLWPEIDLQPWTTNPIIEPGGPGSWDELVLAPTAVDTGSKLYLYFAGARDWPDGPVVIGRAGPSSRNAFIKAVVQNPRLVGDGAGFDAWAVGVPVLVFQGEGLDLYYAGSEGAPFGPRLAVGRAVAETGESPWQRDAEPLLEPGGAGQWDSCAVIPGSVVVGENERRLYYLGSSHEDCNRWLVGMASSSDGIQWTKYNNPSTEAAPFAESDPVFFAGESGAWDGRGLAGVAVRDTGRGWEMFYTGEGGDGRRAIGYAWSLEGIRWHRHPENPVLRPQDDPYAVDALQIHDVTVYGTTYRLYYDYGLANGLGVAEGTVKWPIVVNTTKDELNADGDCSLREAIEAANRDAAVDGCPAGRGRDRVIVPDGTYVLKLTGADEDGNQTGDLDILGDLTLQGAGAEVTILDGDGADRVLDNHRAELVLEGLTLTNGRAPVHTFGGGGLLNESGSVAAHDCVISRNVAPYGGGLANRATAGATSTVTLNNTRVISNTAQGNGGGILQLTDPGGANATLMMTITRSTIAGNTSEGTLRPVGSGGGGGIAAGLQSESEGSVSRLTLIDSTVSGNVAAGTGEFMMGDGGGVLITSGVATMVNCTVSGNRAIGVGVASGYGGGLWVTAALGPGGVTLTNSTVTGNAAASGGGGVAALSVPCMCNELLNPIPMCTTFIPLSPGGPIVTFRNTIVAANQAPVGAACLPCEAELLSQGFNLEDRDSCLFDQMSDLPNTDPLLGPLADNGGPTWTHALLLGSPAVDAAACTDLLTDQRGYPRPVDHLYVPNLADGCDIGAFELQVD